MCKRCEWASNEQLIKYHDNEWGKPVYDDYILFEFIILEGAQAGLSWNTILNRRDSYTKAFHNWDFNLVAQMTDQELDDLKQNSNIIKNKLKIYSARTNAIVFTQIIKEHGSFSDYLWSYVDHTPIINHYQTYKEMPVSSDISDAIAKDLKKRGMKFVGTVIIYAYLQAMGLVNDHIDGCAFK